eukprot:COSAG02_NODE_7577_length_2952_cov_6.611987_1_plen_471_part_00
MHIMVQLKTGQCKDLEVQGTDSILQVRQQLAKLTGVNLSLQRLAFEGKKLVDTQTVAESGLCKESKLFMGEWPKPFAIKLNVGGVKYTTLLSTLRRVEGSTLDLMFDGIDCTSKDGIPEGDPEALSSIYLPRDGDGSYIIDRDGRSFRYILNYLRHEGVAEPLSCFDVEEQPVLATEVAGGNGTIAEPEPEPDQEDDGMPPVAEPEPEPDQEDDGMPPVAPSLPPVFSLPDSTAELVQLQLDARYYGLKDLERACAHATPRCQTKVDTLSSLVAASGITLNELLDLASEELELLLCELKLNVVLRKRITAEILKFRPVEAGLCCWLDGACGVEVDEDRRVQRWTDRSGSKRDAVQLGDGATAPQVTSNSLINGVPALDFGIGDTLKASSGCRVRTIAIVHQFRTVSSCMMLFSQYENQDFSLRVRATPDHTDRNDWHHAAPGGTDRNDWQHGKHEGLWVNGMLPHLSAMH